MASMWNSGKKGSLSPWSQALVVAMLKLNSSKKLSFSYAEIAKHVSKVGGGHPSKQAIAALHGSTKKDKHLYPGNVKPDAEKREPKSKFGKAQKHIVACQPCHGIEKGWCGAHSCYCYRKVSTCCNKSSYRRGLHISNNNQGVQDYVL